MPVEHWLAKTAPDFHPLILDAYTKMKADESVGMPRARALAITGWGMTSLRDREKTGRVLSWAGGAMVRIGTVSLYLDLLDSIAAAHPVDAAPRKARTPSNPFRKGHGTFRREGKEAVEAAAGKGAVDAR
jgi:hypothetical protein